MGLKRCGILDVVYISRITSVKINQIYDHFNCISNNIRREAITQVKHVPTTLIIILINIKWWTLAVNNLIGNFFKKMTEATTNSIDMNKKQWGNICLATRKIVEYSQKLFHHQNTPKRFLTNSGLTENIPEILANVSWRSLAVSPRTQTSPRLNFQ